MTQPWLQGLSRQWEPSSHSGRPLARPRTLKNTAMPAIHDWCSVGGIQNISTGHAEMLAPARSAEGCQPQPNGCQQATMAASVPHTHSAAVHLLSWPARQTAERLSTPHSSFRSAPFITAEGRQAQGCSSPIQGFKRSAAEPCECLQREQHCRRCASAC